MMSADGGQHYKYRAYRRLPQVYEYKASRSRMDAGHTSSGAISHNLVLCRWLVHPDEMEMDRWGRLAKGCSVSFQVMSLLRTRRDRGKARSTWIASGGRIMT
ncbi:hypothetical protein JMJ77_0014255 [Colletotrichum scovillei]|uniref:Uncharacterized protein n=1 Tax=Colletotrichum scovillei TaxID=1209932 RepID=A0A9P7R332_9PEZI|nr:hypothetical protein JMJ77_0014255 [Colletotrichum scovillei]KAG7065782.1 hypothetical protein JMJ78_0012529 [Colletotrichum scovillei]KAG7068383.1 hypothetical protein JMJ76_0008073 [Colletotrichum scovillei]